MCYVKAPRRGLVQAIVMMVGICAALAIAAPAQLTTLASFNGSNGSNPSSPLVQGNDGNFYGTTLYGGASGQACGNPGGGCGTVYKITSSGTVTTVYAFCSQQNCTDGYFPTAGLTVDTDGNLYGATAGNGMTNSGGTIFRISGNGTLTTIYNFCSRGPNCADGNSPVGGLLEASDGNLYGTTARGGSGAACPYNYGCGTVFKFTPGLGGAPVTLYSFCAQSNCTDGLFPQASLAQGTDGNFYGTTYSGGANCSSNGNCGTVFKITPNGTFALVHSFAGSDGTNPDAQLLQGTDGNFYGTTSGLPGTVFQMTPSGTLTTLHTFSGTDGGAPQSALTQAGDGNFYGTTTSDGGGNSTIFKITPSGTLTTKYYFCTLPGCPDGFQPQAGVIQAIDGNLYGTTYGGGANNLGTVFRFPGPATTPDQFVTVTPCRLVDTRGSSPIPGGTWEVFVVPQLGGCNIPTTATAYSLNVTVVPHGRLGYLTIWPAGRQIPLVSTMNSQDGRIKANAAIVPAGASGAVSVYVTDTADVILDIDGYFQPSTGQQLRFFPLTPCRVVDTRQGSNLPQGLGPPSFGDMEIRDLPVLSESPCLAGLPNQPLAYSFNVTVVPSPAGQPLNYLTIWPSDQNQPNVSTLNNPTATVVANAALVPAAANGDVSVFTYNSTDVIIDVNGYFGTPGGLSFYPTTPCRAFDSRSNGGQPFTGELTVNIVGSPCAPPSNSQAYVFNATVVPSPTLGYLTLWADGQPQPVVSTLNAYDGFITSNLAIVPNSNGSTDAFAGQGTTQLILDISGYFAP